jgi:hypothetical protein
VLTTICAHDNPERSGKAAVFTHQHAAMRTRIAKEMVFDPAPAFRGFGWNPREFHPRFQRGPQQKLRAA